MVARNGDKISRVGGERAVPDPALMIGQRCLQVESGGIGIDGRSIGLNGESLLRLGAGGRCDSINEAEGIEVAGGLGFVAARRAVLAVRSWLRRCDVLSAGAESFHFRFGRGHLRWGIIEVEVPDFGCVVGRTGCEVLNIWGEKDSGEVVLVGLEGADGHDASDLSILEHAPDVNIALKRH